MKKIAELADKNPLRVIGLMTGTSMDGLDICAADVYFEEDAPAKTPRPSPVILATTYFPFPLDLRKQIVHCLNGTPELICRLHYDLGKFFATKTKQFLEESHIRDVDGIGVHGQTIYHLSGQATLQIGEPSFLAESIKVPVISDFRARDISVGGTGAPLMPIVDRWLFQQKDKGVICLNLGGIANVTYLSSAVSNQTVLGFDTGPGMSLLDEAIRLLKGDSLDAEGTLASQGSPNESLLTNWMKDPYLLATPPKSTGRDYFGTAWLNKQIPNLSKSNPADLLATLSLFTARSISVNCRAFLPLSDVSFLVVSGGGVHHRTVMNYLARELSPCEVRSSGDFGIDPDMKEALAFALLAAVYFKGIPGNLTAVTGASRPVILGKLTL